MSEAQVSCVSLSYAHSASRPSVHRTGSVDLYGSWDNFSTPYPMQKDRQKGHGHWYGCHNFKNIICHGDPSNCTMPADGGLKMLGLYWYYVCTPQTSFQTIPRGRLLISLQCSTNGTVMPSSTILWNLPRHHAHCYQGSSSMYWKCLT